ncbi:hypothetical protein PWT90_04640 [Aphanocladium album]|nr:hypothetical protein PWT90_04640 [Aphanocladium album]
MLSLTPNHVLKPQTTQPAHPHLDTALHPALRHGNNPSVIGLDNKGGSTNSGGETSTSGRNIGVGRRLAAGAARSTTAGAAGGLAGAAGEAAGAAGETAAGATGGLAGAAGEAAAGAASRGAALAKQGKSQESACIAIHDAITPSLHLVYWDTWETYDEESAAAASVAAKRTRAVIFIFNARE